MKGDIQLSLNTSLKILVATPPSKNASPLPTSGYNILQMAAFPIVKAQDEDLPEGAEWVAMDIELHIIVNGEVMDILIQQWVFPCDQGMTDRCLALPDLSLAAHYIDLQSHGYGLSEDDFDIQIKEMLKGNDIKSKDEMSVIDVELQLYLKEK